MPRLVTPPGQAFGGNSWGFPFRGPPVACFQRIPYRLWDVDGHGSVAWATRSDRDP